jgi:hypothetical protein
MYGGCLPNIYKYISYEYIVKKGYPSAIYLVTTDVYSHSIAQNKADPSKGSPTVYDAQGSCVAAPGKAISHCKIGLEKPVPIADTSTPPCFLVVNAYQDPVESLLRVDLKKLIDATSNKNKNNSNKQIDTNTSAPTTTTETRNQSNPTSSIISAPEDKGLIGNSNFETTMTKVSPDELPIAAKTSIESNSTSASYIQSQLVTLAVWYQFLAIITLLFSWTIITTL